MKQNVGLVIAALLALHGCATPSIEKPVSDGGRTSRVETTPAAAAQGTRADAKAQTEKSRAGAGLRPTLQLRPGEYRDSTTLPDAVIKVDPKSMRLTAEMEGLLQKIADEAKQDDRSIIRLESYVPAGGSPAWDMGIAHKTVQVVKERLQAMGISSRRMSLASFGAEHDAELDSHRHWVEVYLLKSGYGDGRK